EVLGKKIRFVIYYCALESDRARVRASTFARHEDQSARFFICRGECTEKIRWNATASSADARDSPGDGFAQNVFMAEHRCEPHRQGKRQLYREVAVGWSVKFFPGQPDFRFHGPQDFWRKVKKGSDADQKDDKRQQGIEMHESQPAEHGGVFAKAQADIRKWFRRCVAGETGRCLCGVRNKAGAAGEQCNNYRKCRTRV